MDEIAISRAIIIPFGEGEREGTLSLKAGYYSLFYRFPLFSAEELSRITDSFFQNNSLQEPTLDTLPRALVQFIMPSLPAEYFEAAIRWGHDGEDTFSSLAREECFPVVLALGSNLGKREETIKKAIQEMNRRRVVYGDAFSSLYESDPVGYADQPCYVNMVMKGRTKLSPEALLTALKEIENDLGRDWAKRNRPRTIDIDIIYYAAEKRDSAVLTLPHKGRMERAFVLNPLIEIMGEFRDPVTGETAKLKNGGKLTRLKTWEDLWNGV